MTVVGSLQGLFSLDHFAFAAVADVLFYLVAPHVALTLEVVAAAFGQAIGLRAERDIALVELDNALAQRDAARVQVRTRHPMSPGAVACASRS